MGAYGLTDSQIRQIQPAVRQYLALNRKREAVDKGLAAPVLGMSKMLMGAAKMSLPLWGDILRSLGLPVPRPTDSAPSDPDRFDQWVRRWYGPLWADLLRGFQGIANYTFGGDTDLAVAAIAAVVYFTRDRWLPWVRGENENKRRSAKGKSQ